MEILSVCPFVCLSSLLILFLQTLSSRNIPQSTLITQPLPRLTSGVELCVNLTFFCICPDFLKKKYKNSEKIPFLNTFCSMFIAVCWKQFAVTLQHIAKCGEFSHAQFKAQTVYTEENQPTNLCKILHTMIFSRLCLSCVCSSGNSDVRNLCYSISSPQSAVEGGGTT